MILSSEPLIDWITDRHALIVAAWTPEIEAMLQWERPYAECMADELYLTMIQVMLGQGADRDFLKLMALKNSGMEKSTERALCDRFFRVTLKLAQAGCRKEREGRSRSIFPYIRTIVAIDHRSTESELALANITLRCDHPFWRKWHPPLDMDCRCSTNNMLQSQFERRGGLLTSDEELADRETRLTGSWPPAFEPLLDFRR